MDYEHESSVHRQEFTTDQRTAGAILGVDPGFLNHRRILAVVGGPGEALIKQGLAELPAGLSDPIRRVQENHVYASVLITACSAIGAPTLSGLLGAGKGTLFCSVETTCPTPGLYEDAKRARTTILPKGNHDHSVEMEYSTANIHADTTRSQLTNGSEMAIVGVLERKVGETLTFAPLIMGGPIVEPLDAALSQDQGLWMGFCYGEVLVEDIDEFSRADAVDAPLEFDVMGNVSESAFKQCLAELLGENAPQDWGGEQSDLYSAHLHVNGERATGAFLLKGPGGGFSPMKLNNLGKNNDQIVRLANEPASLLVVQNCHDIEPAVRATLRAFAVQPGPVDRRYCLIDGRDSLRVLQAYDKLDRALQLSGDEGRT